MNHRLRGITLIELIIVVAIIGILAAIAYPSYQSQVMASRRADATGDLLGLSGSMERYFTENGSYTGADPATIYSDQSPSDGGTAAYNLAANIPAGGASYTLTATPTGGQTGDKCGNLTITNTGQKGVTGGGVTVDDCWR